MRDGICAGRERYFTLALEPPSHGASLSDIATI
jgi:hypothetical protein